MISTWVIAAQIVLGDHFEELHSINGDFHIKGIGTLVIVKDGSEDWDAIALLNGIIKDARELSSKEFIDIYSWSR